ncbi:hypothetical protein IMZ48_49235 [Candidatus Bathyarchaeota archaeon]|nr:hypothetical protein [Candidatus Bathyarchaeota archaeon]
MSDPDTERNGTPEAERHQSTMATRPSLPYDAPPEAYPVPFPTREEFLAEGRTFDRHDGSTGILLFDGHYVAKYGTKVSLLEGENMLFIKQSTSIPVPTVYSLFHDEETGHN